MAAAYAYADGGQISQDLLCLNYIDRFGAQAVMGRTLGYKEIQHMLLAENVVNAYKSKFATDDWVAWDRDNPDGARLLAEAMRAHGTE